MLTKFVFGIGQHKNVQLRKSEKCKNYAKLETLFDKNHTNALHVKECKQTLNVVAIDLYSIFHIEILQTEYELYARDGLSCSAGPPGCRGAS